MKLKEDSAQRDIYQKQPVSAMHCLGFTKEELQENGGLFTAGEITQQPELWLKIWALLKKQKNELRIFLEQAFTHASLEVILTGAGTSAFIGESLQGPFQKNTGKQTSAIATTDLISHPQHYFKQQGALLLISFARSGESPESVAALELADSLCHNVFHLIITCNPGGKLALFQPASPRQAFVFLLPPEANDQSLAMTSSFTSMLLTGLLISRIHELDNLEKQIQQLAGYARHILLHYADQLRRVAKLNFHRAIFLGSGPLRSVANESELKLQELTDGNVICKHDSFLGFRHGPKAVINSSSLLVYLFSNNEYVHQYELDLVRDVTMGEKGMFRIGVSESADPAVDVDLLIELSMGGEKVEEEFLTICSVIPAQLLGFYKSLELGLTPDNPSKKATITRVVKGVLIYPFKTV